MSGYDLKSHEELKAVNAALVYRSGNQGRTVWTSVSKDRKDAVRMRNGQFAVREKVPEGAPITKRNPYGKYEKWISPEGSVRRVFLANSSAPGKGDNPDYKERIRRKLASKGFIPYGRCAKYHRWPQLRDVQIPQNLCEDSTAAEDEASDQKCCECVEHVIEQRRAVALKKYEADAERRKTVEQRSQERMHQLIAEQNEELRESNKTHQTTIQNLIEAYGIKVTGNRRRPPNEAAKTE